MYNPKAFPISPDQLQKGMDLRDYFAAKAMQSIMNNPQYDIPILDEDVEESPEGSYTKNNAYNRYYVNLNVYSKNKSTTYKVITSYEQRVARESYQIADAMLKEREK